MLLYSNSLTRVTDVFVFISYRIGAPIKRIVNLGRFLGIKDEDNSFNYIMEGYVLSEALE